MRSSQDPMAWVKDTSIKTRAALRKLQEPHHSPPPSITLCTAETGSSLSPSSAKSFLDPHYLPPFAGLPARTASTSSSKSLDCASLTGSSEPTDGPFFKGLSENRAHCLSALSLQEEQLVSRSHDLSSPQSPFSSPSPSSKRSRSSSFNMQIITQV